MLVQLEVGNDSENTTARKDLQSLTTAAGRPPTGTVGLRAESPGHSLPPGPGMVEEVQRARPVTEPLCRAASVRPTVGVLGPTCRGAGS